MGKWKEGGISNMPLPLLSIISFIGRKLVVELEHKERVFFEDESGKMHP